MIPPLPKPEQTDEVYLAAILEELRHLRAALAVEPSPAPAAPKTRTRKA